MGKTYHKRPCDICNMIISTAGLGAMAHLRSHYNAGHVEQYDKSRPLRTFNARYTKLGMEVKKFCAKWCSWYRDGNEHRVKQVMNYKSKEATSV